MVLVLVLNIKEPGHKEPEPKTCYDKKNGYNLRFWVYSSTGFYIMKGSNSMFNKTQPRKPKKHFLSN